MGVHLSNKDSKSGMAKPRRKKVSNILQLPNFRKGLSSKQIRTILPKVKKKSTAKGFKLPSARPKRNKSRTSTA